MPRRKKVKIGDIFTIKTDTGKLAYGQVVAEGIEICCIIFDVVSEDIIPINKIMESPIMFLAYTIEAYINEGKWKVIGNIEIVQNINFKECKVDTLKGYMVTDHLGNILRSASVSEIESLKYHKSVSPAYIEHAVNSKLGNGHWEDYYIDIIYEG